MMLVAGNGVSGGRARDGDFPREPVGKAAKEEREDEGPLRRIAA